MNSQVLSEILEQNIERIIQILVITVQSGINSVN